MGTMNKRRQIRDEISKIMAHDPVGDPHQLQMKQLSRLTADAILELIDTLDKIDISNKRLEESNRKLAERTFWVQLISTIIAVGALYIALFR